jgi:hypothetical protein
VPGRRLFSLLTSTILDVSILAMTKTLFNRTLTRSAIARVVIIAAALLSVAQPVMAATWKGLEPLVSKRADVERVLGRPNRVANSDMLQYNMKDEVVTVYFVTSKFIVAKKLSPALEGTVLQIVVQHQRALETPASLNIVTNSDFKRESKGNVVVLTNAKEGLIYTFVNERLKTTRYTFSEEQLARQAKGIAP